MSQKPKSKISTLEKLQLRQKLTRNFVPVLSPAECLLLDYVFDRTIMWDRLSRRVTAEEFVRGNKIQGGLPLGERTVKSALSSLRTRGVLKASGDRRSGMTYEINFDWNGALSINISPESSSDSDHPTHQIAD